MGSGGHFGGGVICNFEGSGTGALDASIHYLNTRKLLLVVYVYVLASS